MATSSIKHRTTATLVRLDISGDDAVIDMGDNPAYHQPVPVTELAISYKTTESFDGDDVTTTSEVQDITYRVTGQDYVTASVHWDFLDKPEAWPDWVRELVDMHQPDA